MIFLNIGTKAEPKQTQSPTPVKETQSKAAVKEEEEEEEEEEEAEEVCNSRYIYLLCIIKLYYHSITIIILSTLSQVDEDMERKINQLEKQLSRQYKNKSKDLRERCSVEGVHYKNAQQAVRSLAEHLSKKEE